MPQTEDGSTNKVTSGHLNSSMMSIKDSEVLDIVSDDATKVIPLLTTHRSHRAAAWNAEVLTSFRLGLIPQTYLWLNLRNNTTDPRAILSSVKAIFRGTGVHCSVLSQRNARGLVRVCESSSSQTQS